MDSTKTIWLDAAAILLSSVMAYLANTARYFGKAISREFPCVSSPENSFPCYGAYDLVILVIASCVGLVFAVRLMIKLRARHGRGRWRVKVVES